MSDQLPSKSCSECSRLRQALQEVVESTQSRAPAHHIARTALNQKPLSVQTFRPAERHGMDWKCACGELDSRHICPGLLSETRVPLLDQIREWAQHWSTAKTFNNSDVGYKGAAQEILTMLEYAQKASEPHEPKCVCTVCIQNRWLSENGMGDSP